MEIILALKSQLQTRSQNDLPAVPGNTEEFEYTWTLDCSPSVIVKDDRNVSMELMKEIEGIQGQVSA